MLARTILCIFVSISATACLQGKLKYLPPSPLTENTNSKVIEKPRDLVWDAAVPALGRQFFVINNMDRSSGFINLSYSGDPERYIDCGRITSVVENARGMRTYDFPASRAQQAFEVKEGPGLFMVQRKLALEGRINLIFEVLGPKSTRVTASTHYIVSKSVTFQQFGANLPPQTTSDSISFNSGGSATFAGKAPATQCIPTGRLEEEILAAVQ